MKKKIITLFIVFIFIILQPYNNTYASIIKVSSNSNFDKIYYVSNEKEFELMLNLIKAHMETKVKVVFSKKMIPSSKNNLLYYYSKISLKYNYLYQNNVITYTDKIGVCYTYSIDSIKYNKNNTVSLIYYFSYYDTPEQSTYINNIMNTAIKNNITKFNTDYDKATWAYHWIVDNVNIDKTENNFSAYDGLTESGTVCCGYATLYCSLASKLGLDCRYIEGKINKSNINNHAWNIIKLNNKWYCADLTWCDNYNTDKYFLKSKDTFAKDDYKNHQSSLYEQYIKDGETFATSDYMNSNKSEEHGISPSVYNIETDILKRNILNVNEKYMYIIANPDNIKIEFANSNPSVASIDNNGIITGLNKGTTIITIYNTKLNFEQKCIITVK